jgi:hypothetical protein
MQDGTSVAVGTAGAAAGIPTAAGIANAVKVDGSFAYDDTTGVWNLLTPVAGCTVTYAPATGAVTVQATVATCAN